MDFLLRLAATMVGIWVSSRLIPGISFTEGTTLQATLITLAAIAFAFTLVNSLIKPVVKTLTFPLYLITIGLFALVVNSLMFLLTGWLATRLGFPFETGGFWSCLGGSIITSFIASFVSGMARDKKKKRR